MKVEEAIGRQIARLREARGMSLSELGEAVGLYLDRPWRRQAVHQAERGRRAFTAAELTALALALETSIPTLLHADGGADAEPVELPCVTLTADEYRGLLLRDEEDAPLDGVEELIVALHDIGEVLARPTLTRLAKIGRVAEQV